MAENNEMGFVCPEWAVPHWNPDDCTVLSCTDGTYAAVDHQLQVTVFTAPEASAVRTFLNNKRNGGMLSEAEILMRETEAYYNTV